MRSRSLAAPRALRGRLPKKTKYALLGAAGVGTVLAFYLVGRKRRAIRRAVHVSMSARERRRIGQLAPDVRAAYEAFLYAAAARGIRIFTGRTQGTIAKTAAHNKAGRSDVHVSWHDLTPPRGIDIQVYSPTTGRRISSPKTRAEIALYRKVLRLAEKYGFRQIAFHKDGSRRFLSSGAWDAYHIEHRGPYRGIQVAARATGVKYA